jgi:hypothetical protein
MNVVALFCEPSFSPQGNWGLVPDGDVQQALRTAFRLWGLPARLRVDNGKPWGSWSDLPPQLALWLIGLGIDMIWNPAKRPQKNGVVERSQGTGKRWAEPRCCATWEALQERFTDLDRLQREEYPNLRGHPRWEIYPELRHSGRRYSLSWERQHWDLGRVMAHLSEYVVPRRVDRGGKLSVYNRNHYVGILHAGKTVYVMFDPECQEWLITDVEGKELRRRHAPEITRERIMSLQVLGKK